MKKFVVVKVVLILFSLTFLSASGAEMTAAEQEKLLRQGMDLFRKKKNAEAFKIFEKLVAQKNALATTYAGFIKYNNNEKKAAAEYFKRASDLGELTAKYHLAQMLFKGDVIAANQVEAFRLFKEVANISGHKESCYLVACILSWGDIVPRDVVSGMRYMKKAARPSKSGAVDFKSQSIAQLLYGVWCMEEEKGKKLNFPDAYTFLELAAAQKMPEAWRKLGWLYYYGKGIPEPDKKRAELCFLAAERLEKNTQTEFNIGLIRWEAGDEKGTRYWMELAAAGKLPAAVNFLKDLKMGKIKFTKKKPVQSAALPAAVNSFFNAQQEILGTSVRNMAESPRFSRDKMLRLPYPRNIRIEGWEFSFEELEKEIADHLALNREGDRVLKDEKFDREPLESHLGAINPTIRFINARGEKALFEAMKKSKFRLCSRAETLAMLKKLKDQRLDNKERKDSLWQLRSDLYFHCNADFSGRWHVRSYSFISVKDNKPQIVTSFSSPPSKEDATMTEGILRRDPACLNNFAVRLEEREIATFFTDDETVLEILTALAAAGNKTACYNLGVFYFKRGQKQEAEKYFKEAQISLPPAKK